MSLACATTAASLPLSSFLLTGEGKVELLHSGLVLVHATEQRLHLHDEQVGAVLPRFGHRTDVLQGEFKKIQEKSITNQQQNINPE